MVTTTRSPSKEPSHAPDCTESLRIDVADGTLWRVSPESDEEPSHTFYHGSGGIAVFYLELYRATSQERFLNIALKAGEESIA